MERLLAEHSTQSEKKKKTLSAATVEIENEETTGVSPGGSFLFVEEEGETSSERLLAGHTVLPFAHNHRNPGGSAEGLQTPDILQMHKQGKKLMAKAEYARLSPEPNADR
ncbi:hypothetical protein KUCAC02_027603 [Chaenocephalus aceratus]|uniref:Uncharacterized protein n=1 Tax=Chaenocephalus aceratus TaxID=36190 RepID=A0ACB9W4I0_CHAAC|nr:hypothetical protein KUCAC02_027603 [Chaenocephalus aceratus]